MLRIRKEQMEAIAAASFDAFVRDAVAHVADLTNDPPTIHPPVHRPSAGDEPLRTWVERRITRALELGLIEEASVLRHLEVAARWGEDFADGPAIVGFVDEEQICEHWPTALIQLESQSRGAQPVDEGDEP